MSISSSMNAGVAALTVNATKLSAIADNISNSGTNGYKRNSVEFQTMVTPSLNVSGQYSAGGVKSVVTRRVIELVASADGSVARNAGEFKASVPFVGGKVEKVAAEMTQKYLAKEATVGAEWLAG